MNYRKNQPFLEGFLPPRAGGKASLCPGTDSLWKWVVWCLTWLRFDDCEDLYGIWSTSSLIHQTILCPYEWAPSAWKSDYSFAHSNFVLLCSDPNHGRKSPYFQFSLLSLVSQSRLACFNSSLFVFFVSFSLV